MPRPAGQSTTPARSRTQTNIAGFEYWLHQLIGHYWTVDCVPQQLFGSAVAYYAQYRPGYPQDLVDALAARAGLDGTQRVLDIGCGTGQITIPLARHAQAVMAIDPIPGMLAGGRQAARAAGAGNITWLAR